MIWSSRPVPAGETRKKFVRSALLAPVEEQCRGGTASLDRARIDNSGMDNYFSILP